MRRPLLTLTALLAATIAAAAPSASAAIDRCRPRSGEHTLARSAQAVVLERIVRQTQHFPLQTIVGCSRRSGKRRVLDTLQRRSVDDATKLIGVKLTGTRVAYVLVLDTFMARTTVIAEDAIHGGRRHPLDAQGPPFFGTGASAVLSWTVDRMGEVAWVVRTVPPTAPDTFAGIVSLIVWRAGLGLRLVDGRAATITDLRLRDGKLGWRRDGQRRSVDLAAVPRSACVPGSAVGTLTFDLVGYGNPCLRATGVTTDLPYLTRLLDANGPYVTYGWVVHVHGGVGLADLVAGTSSNFGATDLDGLGPYGFVTDAVVDDRGSVAWTVNGRLWVRDAAGSREIPGTGTGPLWRDGSTVTWSGGGPTVTLSP